MKSRQIDREMLVPVRCPDNCQQGIGYENGRPFFCGLCEGLALVWYPASLVSVIS
jgi:hypothetical protein